MRQQAPSLMLPDPPGRYAGSWAGILVTLAAITATQFMVTPAVTQPRPQASAPGLTPDARALAQRELAQLRGSFKELLSASPRSFTLQAEQVRWARGNNEALRTTADAEAVTTRRELVEGTLAQTRQALRQSYTAQQVGGQCVTLPAPNGVPATTDGRCTVTGFGKVNGDRRLLFQVQERAGAPGDMDPPSETVVFGDDGDGNYHVVGWADFEALQPILAYGPLGDLLVIRSYPQGAAGRNYLQSVYVADGPEKVWRELDVSSWEDDLERRLGNLTVNSRPEIDWQEGRARAPLMRPGDAMCCPSGGTATITLAIRDRALAVKAVTVAGRKP